MKIKTLTFAVTILLALISFTNLNAKSENVVYQNNYTTTSTFATEKMMVDSKTLTPNKRIIYERDADNRLIHKETYIWNEYRGWVSSCKYQYYYSISGKLTKLKYSEWNKKNNIWETKNTLHY